MTQPPGKRIVSKGEYAIQIVRKIGWTVGSIGSLLTGGILLTGGLLFLILFLIFCRVHQDPNNEDAVDVPGVGIVSLIATVAGATCMGAAFFAAKRADKLRVDIPLTRANTAHLPTIDSLVRASQEPLESQEMVLLRAAIQSEQSPVEQLVRPAESQEQP